MRHLSQGCVQLIIFSVFAWIFILITVAISATAQSLVSQQKALTATHSQGQALAQCQTAQASEDQAYTQIAVLKATLTTLEVNPVIDPSRPERHPC
jgi:hypothetical protein